MQYLAQFPDTPFLLLHLKAIRPFLCFPKHPGSFAFASNASPVIAFAPTNAFEVRRPAAFDSVTDAQLGKGRDGAQQSGLTSRHG